MGAFTSCWRWSATAVGEQAPVASPVAAPVAAPDAAWPMVCHQCGGPHPAWRCPERGEPEFWQTTPTSVEANWGGPSGEWRCQHCNANWVRTRDHTPPAALPPPVEPLDGRAS